MNSQELERHAVQIAQTLCLETTESRPPRVPGIAVSLTATNVSITLKKVQDVINAALSEVTSYVMKPPQKEDASFELMIFTDDEEHGAAHLFARYRAQQSELVLTCIRSSDEIKALRKER